MRCAQSGALAIDIYEQAILGTNTKYPATAEHQYCLVIVSFCLKVSIYLSLYPCHKMVQGYFGVR